MPVGGYMAVAAVLWLLAHEVVRRFTEDPLGVTGRQYEGMSWLEGWFRFDGGWYLAVAHGGYSYQPDQQSTVAFFPGYPLAMRFVGSLLESFITPLGNLVAAGVVVTVVCGLAAVVMFWRWSSWRLAPTAALTAVLLLLLYPYSWYLYGAVYGDALYLAAALAAFMLLERDHALLAGVAGAVATGTRSVGVAVVVGLVLRTLERRDAIEWRGRWKLPGVRWQRLRPSDAGVLVSLAGILGYAGFLWHRFGDPFLFSSVQAEWGQPATPVTWLKWDFFNAVLRGEDRLYALGLVVQALLAAAVLLSVPFVRRRFGIGYATYVLVAMALPVIGSQDFQGNGRYVLGAFPTFALAGEWLCRAPRVRRVLFPALSAGLLVMTARFANGQYLA